MKVGMQSRMIVLSSIGLVAMACMARAHCQIPCGIYDDGLRLKLMAEHVTTIEKSMKEIVDLSAQEKPDYNQLVRWVQNKEDHVAEFTEIVTDYFMAQRIKPADEKNKTAYDVSVKQLTLLHSMLVEAMKAKQTTDLKHVVELRRLLEAFAQVYPSPASAPVPAKAAP